MTGIGKVDQIVLHLRAQLQGIAAKRERAGTEKVRREAGPVDRLRSLGDIEPGDPETRRKFIRAVLTEELGEGLANQSEFDRISNEVWRLIEQDAELKAQLDEALIELGN